MSSSFDCRQSASSLSTLNGSKGIESVRADAVEYIGKHGI